MSEEKKEIPNSGRKLFFGLFVFPLVIAIGMALLLCVVVLMTHEKETPETLIASIKKTSPGKRWQKAFELSNELNQSSPNIREKGVLKEIIQILRDPKSYDEKTRGYMALALSHFNEPEAVNALRQALNDEGEDVRLYSLWALGVLKAREAVPDILPYIDSDSPESRKTAAYVLGAIGDPSSSPKLRMLLADPVADVRWNAALALARLNDGSGIDILLKMLRREELAGEHHMNDQQIEAVMINATKGLALIRKPEAIKILESVSKNDKSLKVRQAAWVALQLNSGK